jgi:hypothetical protein
MNCPYSNLFVTNTDYFSDRTNRTSGGLQNDIYLDITGIK